MVNPIHSLILSHFFPMFPISSPLKTSEHQFSGVDGKGNLGKKCVIHFFICTFHSSVSLVVCYIRLHVILRNELQDGFWIHDLPFTAWTSLPTALTGRWNALVYSWSTEPGDNKKQQIIYTYIDGFENAVSTFVFFSCITDLKFQWR